MTWCLFALSQDKIRQQKLREELLSVSTDTPTMDELMSLPYLDNVLRETLRRHPPVTNSVRQATKDDFIPLSKPYTDIYGQVHDSIQSVHSSIPFARRELNLICRLSLGSRLEIGSTFPSSP